MSNLVNLVRIVVATFGNASILSIRIERLHQTIVIESEQMLFTAIRWARMGWKMASRPVDLCPIAPINTAITCIQGVCLILYQVVAFPLLIFILDYVQRPCSKIAITVNPQIG